MKSLAAQLAHFLRKDTNRKNLRALARLLAVLVVIVAVYSVIFHLLMLREGRQFTWFTGIYWTLTVISTLGFGDVTFRSDLGRFFSMWVLCTGTVYMLTTLIARPPQVHPAMVVLNGDKPSWSNHPPETEYRSSPMTWMEYVELRVLSRTPSPKHNSDLYTTSS